MGDNEIDILEAKALVEGEKLGIVDRIVGRIISRKVSCSSLRQVCLLLQALIARHGG